MSPVQPVTRDLHNRSRTGSESAGIVLKHVPSPELHFGHPCAEVLGRLEGVPTYRTDEQGTVEVVSDGARVWVETER